ncbi:MAG: WG repeat-containing protein [Firmicutes bacterium]|nr:WG repeat-containing protein [Candidatus Colimorpha enterica]
MSKTVKDLIIRLTAILLFAAVIGATVLYQAGVYDISFIERKQKPVRPVPVHTTGGGTEGDDTTVTSADETTEPAGTEPDYPYSDEEPARFISSLGEIGDDYVIFDGRYDGAQKLFRVGFSSTQNKDSVSTQTVTRYFTRMKDGGGSLVIDSVEEEVPVFIYRPYFGYIVEEVGDYFDFFTPSGKKVVTKFTGTFTYQLSVNGNPTVQIGKKYYEITNGGLEGIDSSLVLSTPFDFTFPTYGGPTDLYGLYPFSEVVTYFTEVTTKAKETKPPVTDPDESTEEGDDPSSTEPDGTEPEATEPSAETTEVITVAEPVLEAEGGEDSSVESEELTEEDEDETTADPLDTSGYVFPTKVKDWQTYEVNGRIFRAHIYTGQGYKDAEGNVVIEPIYKQVYGFGENGLGAVLTLEDELVFIDTTGKEVINMYAKPAVKVPEMLQIKVRQHYLPPLNLDVSALGSYYFDHGYTMVRYAYGSYKTNDIIYGTENRLVSEKGKEFDIPSGYTLESYSDGIMLLSKDGKYGYYRLSESWLTSPVYEEAPPFVQGLAVVKAEGHYGMIDTDGHYVIPPVYEHISDASSGLIFVYGNETWGFLCLGTERPSEETTN